MGLEKGKEDKITIFALYQTNDIIMKQLIYILLGIILFSSCSSDDKEFDPSKLTPSQKDDFLVGQWLFSHQNGGELVRFYKDRTFDEFKVLDYSKKLIQKKNTGSYKFLDYGFEYAGVFQLLIIIDENSWGYPGTRYERNTEIFTEVEE